MGQISAFAERLGAIRLDSWADQSACIGKWDVLENPNETPAKTMCAHCPVITECTRWVLGLNQHQDPGGVVAGMNEKQRNRARRRRQLAPRVLVATRRCPICQDIKPASDFYRNSSHNDGLSTHCRACISDRDKRARQDRKAVGQ